MPISPQEIAHREFFAAKNGYDKDEVRAFLNVVARDQRELLDRVQALADRGDEFSGLGGEISSILQQAGETAERLVSEAKAKAAEVRSRAEEEAHLLRKATEDSTDRLKEEAEQYAFEVRNSAEKAAREQQVNTVERVGRLLAGESTVRERLYSLELTLQGIRGELKGAAEGVYPELTNLAPPAPPEAPPALGADESGSIPVIDLREDRRTHSNGSSR